ncbi:MAG: efflux RND transporter permease subunit, partial [Planctomycetaceae bacterium]|nr:efflux RND transporter permease subunit [Planctomycetaceae bacterium]
MTRFFIDRPIFSWVISIVILLAGAVAVFVLPVAQYPDITPPTVTVSASYPGANARVVADSVAAPIEQQVNGVDHMMYMSSQCTNDGNYTLTVTFELGTDPNMNQVLVQNRVSLAMSQLPTQVQIQGVNVKKKSPDLLLAVNLFSPGRIYDDLYLSNYATTRIKDELLRLPGVGDVTYLGQRDYSMRVWLDPEKMAMLNVSAGDIVSVIQKQNVQVDCIYPGASAHVVAESVAAPIEQQVNGVEGMLYMASQAGNDGTYTLTVTFNINTDLNTALVMVQNRVTLAMPQLPTEVQLQGITIRKKTPDILLVISFFSPDGRYDDIYLSNYATIFVKDELLRVEGVSDINVQGQRDYSIRAWLDPQKLAAMKMTALDVAAAIRG